MAAGAIVLLAAMTGAAGAWASPAGPAQGRTGENPLPKLAIVYSQRGPAGGGANLRIGDPLGLMSRELTTPTPGIFDGYASRSPDGWLVLFERDTAQGSDIGIVDLREPGVVTIIDTGCRATPDCAGSMRPTWSFDGRRVLFTRVMGPFDADHDAASAALYSVMPDGGDLRRVSSPALAHGTAEIEARFSPGGSTRVFLRVKRVDGVLRSAIYKSSADGTDIRQMTPWRLDAEQPSISPARSGRTAGLVAFDTHGDASPGRDIALMPLACESVSRCTASIRFVTHNDPGPRSAFGASWSADGKSLSYAVRLTPVGDATIWTSEWDGTWAREMTPGTAAFSPAWGQ